ncbi:MAG: hypothetical protein ABT940_14865, partial [Alphaproteobacteria bacterium]
FPVAVEYAETTFGGDFATPADYRQPLYTLKTTFDYTNNTQTIEILTKRKGLTLFKKTTPIPPEASLQAQAEHAQLTYLHKIELQKRLIEHLKKKSALANSEQRIIFTEDTQWRLLQKDIQQAQQRLKYLQKQHANQLKKLNLPKKRLLLTRKEQTDLYNKESWEDLNDQITKTQRELSIKAQQLTETEKTAHPQKTTEIAKEYHTLRKKLQNTN